MPTQVTGSSGEDVFVINQTDTTYLGGAGLDVYVVTDVFDGSVIDDLEEAGTNQQPDVLRFQTYTIDDLNFERDGLDLIVTTNDDSQTLLIEGQFLGPSPILFGNFNANPDRGVGTIYFSGGGSWGEYEIALAVSNPLPTNQRIIGTDSLDVLDGGGGRDFLSGGDSPDYYFFGRGYGSDTIHEKSENLLITGEDTVVFGEGISPEDVTFSTGTASGDLVIRINGTTDQLTIKGFLTGAYTGVFGTIFFDRVERFEFANGDVITWQEAAVLAISGAATNGDDRIIGFDYEDRIDGGPGDDFLSGGNESDTYLFGYGSGNDRIKDQLTNVFSGSDDTVEFKHGVEESDVFFSRHGPSLNLIIELRGSSDTLTLENFFNGYSDYDVIENFVWSDGTSIGYRAIQKQVIEESATSGNDRVFGTDFNDDIRGKKGDDYLSGGDGNDTYIWRPGDGNDTILDGTQFVLLGHDRDTLLLSGTVRPSQVSLRRYENSLNVTYEPSGETIRILNQFGGGYDAIDRIQFSDGTIWGDSEISQKLVEGAATSGNDFITGTDGQDVIEGMAGDDRLFGLRGNDTYIWRPGDGNDIIDDRNDTVLGAYSGDRLEFKGGVTPDEVEMSRSGDSLKITYVPTDETITIKSQFGFYWEEVDFIEFSNGVVWNDNQIRSQVLLQVATNGDDRIIGFDGIDEMNGGRGDDYLDGSDGADRYIWSPGDGSDVIDDSGWNSGDTLVLGGRSRQRDFTYETFGDNFVLQHKGTGETITLLGQFDTSSNLEIIRFSDGSTVTSINFDDLL